MTVKTIHQAIPAIMAEIEPIAKARRNQAQGYSFRGIDDVYQALQLILAKHGVFTTSEILSERTEERQTSKGSSLIYRVLHIRWRFFASDGSSVPSETIGEGMDSGDKASNKAMSVAHKYALLQAFCVPTEEPKDPENDSHEVAAQPRSVVAQRPTEPDAPPKPNYGPDQIFSSTDGRAVNAVEGFLRKHQIDTKHWPAVVNQLNGRAFKDLRAVVDEVTVRGNQT
jgi:hypothetical protein